MLGKYPSWIEKCEFVIEKYTFRIENLKCHISYINDNGKKVTGAAAFNHLIKEMGGYLPAALKLLTLGGWLVIRKLSMQDLQNELTKPVDTKRRLNDRK
jgi:hypothetical protein